MVYFGFNSYCDISAVTLFRISSAIKSRASNYSGNVSHLMSNSMSLTEPTSK